MKRYLLIIACLVLIAGCSLFESDGGGESSGGGGETETTLVDR